jgi:PAS domain S-box-containing protein
MGRDKDKRLNTATALYRRAEEHLQAAAPKLQLPQTVAETQGIVHELQVHQVELELQNAELTRTRDDLEKALSTYADLYDFAPIGYFTLNKEAVVLAVNLSGAGLIGKDRSRVLGRNFVTFVTLTYRHVCAACIAKVFVSQTKEVCEVALLSEGDSPLFVQIEAVVDATGQECRVAVMEISERKRLEDELKKTNMHNELILASAGEGIVGLDLEGNHTFVNAAAAAMLGHSVDELIGKPSHAIWHYARLDGSVYPMEQCPVYAAYKEATIYAGEEMFVRKDGTFFPVQFTSRPIVIDGKISGAVLTFNDITERKRIEAALQESEERFRATFNQAPVGIGHVTPDGRWLRINRKYCDIVGYSEEEFKTLTVKDITHPDDLAETLQNYHRMLTRDLENYCLEKRYIQKNGSIVWVNLTASMVFAADGKPSFAVGIVEDITARKQLEAEVDTLHANLAELAAELEAANLELEAFTYTVAHDLRKPLTVINGYCQILKEICSEKLDESCKRYINEAYDGTWRMNGLIDALLNFSQLAHVQPSRELVDLSTVATEVSVELQHAEPERQVTFLIAAGVRVTGETALLRVVLNNLLGNAWKFTGKQEQAVIEFGAIIVDGEQACFVRDNGVGFDPADVGKIFIPFQQLPGDEECKGYGIGLATVERIIRRHGGRVWAEGEPGKGACFYFAI